jgi:hypothetical protein
MGRDAELTINGSPQEDANGPEADLMVDCSPMGRMLMGRRLIAGCLRQNAGRTSYELPEGIKKRDDQIIPFLL